MSNGLVEEGERAYRGLHQARRASGIAKIAMGVHLAAIHDTKAWEGRTGARSFRSFLVEEGIEPRAALQYMKVARAFVLEHAVDPADIALVGMRVLFDAADYLDGPDAESGYSGNVSEVVSIVTSMPAAEAREALQESYVINTATAERRATMKRVDGRVHQIISDLDGLPSEARADLFRMLRVGQAKPAAQAPTP